MTDHPNWNYALKGVMNVKINSDKANIREAFKVARGTMIITRGYCKCYKRGEMFLISPHFTYMPALVTYQICLN